MVSLPDKTNPLASDRACTRKLVTTCMALAVGGVILASEPARHHATDMPTVANAKWAAQPCLRVPVPATPMVSDPVRPVGTPAPPRVSEGVTVVAVETNRWVARTRWGGLYGP